MSPLSTKFLLSSHRRIQFGGTTGNLPVLLGDHTALAPAQFVHGGAGSRRTDGCQTGGPAELRSSA